MSKVWLCIVVLACLCVLARGTDPYKQRYDQVRRDCGDECAPSGTCAFDVCRLDCIRRDFALYYRQPCALQSFVYYEGSGHCRPNIMNACNGLQYAPVYNTTEK